MAEIFMIIGGLGTLIAVIALIRGEWILMQVPNRKFAAFLLVFFGIVLAFGLWLGPSPMPDPSKTSLLLTPNSLLS